MSEKKEAVRKILLDPSSPTTTSIWRIFFVFVTGVIAVTGLFFVVYTLRSLLFLIILSVFCAYILNPIVRLIRKLFRDRNLEKFMPRSLAIVITYLIVFVVLALTISYLAPKVVEQSKQLSSNLPAYTASIQSWMRGVNNRFERLALPDHIQAEVNTRVASFLGSTVETVTTAAGDVVLSIASYLPWLILVPIFAFFFLKDVNVFRDAFLRWFPAGSWQNRADSLLEDVNVALAAYIRAQIIACILIGTVCFIGFYFLDLNYAILLAIMAGIFEFIPLVGPVILACIAVIIAGLTSPWLALDVAIFLIVLRLIHDYVTYPRIVRKGIHLHSLAVILSVLAGEQLAGIPGVFLSIPCAALITVLLKHIRKHREGEIVEPELKVEVTEA